FAFLLGAEEAHVGVGGGDVGVFRVDHQGYAEGLEAAPGQFWTVGAGRRWQVSAEHMGEVHTALLDQRAVLDHPRPATTAGGTGPGVLVETGLAILGRERGADAVLQI